MKGISLLVLLSSFLWTCSSLQLASSLGSDLTPKSRAPFTFFHLGDSQIGMSEDGIENEVARLKLVAQEANKAGALLALIAGDITNDRTEEQIIGIYEGLEEFNMPVALVPGNHDVFDMVTLENYRKIYGQHDYYNFAAYNVEFIALNSITLISNLTEFEAETRKQWEWAEATLKRARDLNRDHIIVFMHYPPFNEHEFEEETYFNFPPAQRARFLTLMRNYGVKVVLAGHKHETFQVATDDEEVMIYVVGGTSAVFDDNGFGYREFSVIDSNPLTQTYKNILWEKYRSKKPMECPSIFMNKKIVK